MAVLCLMPSTLPAKDSAADAAWKKNMEEGKKALNAGQYYEASDRYTDALALAEKFEAKDSRLAETLHQLAAVHLGLQEYAEAKRFETRAVDLDEIKYGTNDYHLIKGDMLLGSIFLYLKDFPQAEVYYARAQSLAEWKYGKFDRVVGACVENRAQAALSAGRLEEAEKLFKEAIPLMGSMRMDLHMGSDLHVRQSVTAADEASLWSVWNGLGLVYRQEAKFSKAEDAFHKSIKLIERNYGKNSRDLCSPLANLATTLALQKKFDEAEVELRHAMDIAKDIGKDHPVSIQLRNTLDEIERQKKAGSTLPAAAKPS